VSGKITAVFDRAHAVANVLGSLRLDGLEPTGPVRELADLWALDKASAGDLREAEHRLFAGEALEDMLTSVAAASDARRHG
jgi:hypothetical protein